MGVVVGVAENTASFVCLFCSGNSVVCGMYMLTEYLKLNLLLMLRST